MNVDTSRSVDEITPISRAGDARQVALAAYERLIDLLQTLDAANERQVRDHAKLTPAERITALREVAPAAVAGRMRHVPALPGRHCRRSPHHRRHRRRVGFTSRPALRAPAHGAPR